ncbi:hypothetical protein N0V90_000464 [Kalmusia sp. IMI 367209]|nr:hypothetical protein N0V90_000464 [Kalmusia sp. IMI 367209]
MSQISNAPPTTVAQSLTEQVGVLQVAENEFVSTAFPKRLGNIKPIAYGGCARAVAVHAASKTVKADFQIYSILGYFLGPTLIDRAVKCSVHHVRDTKTFATRRVVVSQTWPDGSVRVSLELFADFQAPEPAVAMVFDPPPTHQYKPAGQLPTFEDYQKQFTAEGKVSSETIEKMRPLFELMGEYFEQKPCAEGISGQNMMGLAKDISTTQDKLFITEKHSAEWIQAKSKLTSLGEQLGALAFNMDGGLSFLPLMHDHKFLDDAGDCSSLDFALRIFSPQIDMNNWHLKERKTIAGGNGRTFSEARLWDESGKLVAIETQQCILRPPRPKINL